MKRNNKALVVGALGVAGRHIVEELARRRDWHIVGLARRNAPATASADYLAVDICDEAACRRAPAPLDDITHVFYTARRRRPPTCAISS